MTSSNGQTWRPLVTWDKYRKMIIEDHLAELPSNWFDKDAYKCNYMSIPGLWSWRGVQCKKYLGYLPSPEEMGITRFDPFYDPDFVDLGLSRKFGGEIIKITPTHHDRQIRRNERLWRERVVPLLRELSKREKIPEGFKWS